MAFKNSTDEKFNDQIGGVTRLKDIAKVVDSYEDPKTYSRYNSKNSITLLISKRYGENILDVTYDIEKKPNHKHIEITENFENSSNIDSKLTDIENKLTTKITKLHTLLNRLPSQIKEQSSSSNSSSIANLSNQVKKSREELTKINTTVEKIKNQVQKMHHHKMLLSVDIFYPKKYFIY